MIYDAYVEDQERMEQQDRMAKMKAAAKKVEPNRKVLCIAVAYITI